jgi:hypothetical protein
MNDTPKSSQRSGAEEFWELLKLVAVALLLAAGLRAALYFRPSPFGGVFVSEISNYFPHALFYGLWGMLLLALPSLLICRICFRRELGSKTLLWLHWGTTFLLALALISDHFDNEVMRFMGVHPNPDFFKTYRHVGASKDMVIRLLQTDEGGAWVSLVLWVAAPALLVAFSLYLWRKAKLFRRRGRHDWVMSLILAVVLLVPAVAYMTPGGRFRIARVRSYWMTLAASSFSSNRGMRPKEFEQFAKLYQAAWRQGTSEPGWTFGDKERVYLRHLKDPGRALDSKRRNIIVVQVENLRGHEVGFFDPRHRPSVTPFLDSLARSSDCKRVHRRSLFAEPAPRSQHQCTVRDHQAFLLPRRP